MSGPDGFPPHDLGRRGERWAAEYLAGLGWTILARNYRFGRREVDVIALDGRVLVIVEVKTRSTGSHGGPLAAVGHRKRRDVEAVGEHFLLRSGLSDLEGVRFDVVGIEGDPAHPGAVRHVRDAWRPGWY